MRIKVEWTAVTLHRQKYQEYLDAIPDPAKLDAWHSRWDHFRF